MAPHANQHRQVHRRHRHCRHRPQDALRHHQLQHARLCLQRAVFPAGPQHREGDAPDGRPGQVFRDAVREPDVQAREGYIDKDIVGEQWYQRPVGQADTADGVGGGDGGNGAEEGDDGDGAETCGDDDETSDVDGVVIAVVVGAEHEGALEEEEVEEGLGRDVEGEADHHAQVANVRCREVGPCGEEKVGAEDKEEGGEVGEDGESAEGGERAVMPWAEDFEAGCWGREVSNFSEIGVMV